MRRKLTHQYLNLKGSGRSDMYLGRCLDMLVAIMIVLSATVLAAWLIEPLARVMPTGWDGMKASTALSVLISAVVVKRFAIGLAGHRQLTLDRWAIAAGLVVFFLAMAALGSYLYPVDPIANLPGRMSPVSTAFFLLMGLALIMRGWNGRLPYNPLKSPLLYMVVLVASVLTTYLFTSTEVQSSAATRLTSAHTVSCMLILVFVLLLLEVKQGNFLELFGRGLGSQYNRHFMPWLIVVPFVTIGLSNKAIEHDLISVYTASTFESMAISLSLLVLGLMLARKINALEQELRELALFDELTGIFNRRAFYMLGQHLFNESRRNSKVLQVLFFDMDGLKEVNDHYGHEAGSKLLKDFAGLLHDTFRDTDIVARLGGDEFAVLSLENDVGLALERLDKSISTLNKVGSRCFEISYSVGQVSAQPGQYPAFADVVAVSDSRMYEQKRLKRTARILLKAAGQANTCSEVFSPREPRSGKRAKSILNQTQ